MFVYLVGGFADLGWACSYVLRFDWDNGATHFWSMWVFLSSSSLAQARHMAGTWVSEEIVDTCKARLGTGNISLLLHSSGQSKSQGKSRGQPRSKGWGNLPVDGKSFKVISRHHGCSKGKNCGHFLQSTTES